MAKGPYGFPAEDLLADVPPNYPNERMMLSVQLVLVFLFFIFLPIMLARPVEPEGSAKSEPVLHEKREPIPTSKASIKGGDSKKVKGKQRKTTKPVAVSTSDAAIEDEPQVLEVHPFASVFAAVGTLVSLTALIVMSPDNSYTTNGVFQAPLFTREECQTILQFADKAAQTNYNKAQSAQASNALTGDQANKTVQQLLQNPEGWNKMRHSDYPTTDLNLVTDPFTKEDREWIQHKMDVRLAPIIQRVWGIPPSSIRANDMFVVRYDEKKQTHLVNHTDNGVISINILLDEDFEGGGTRFWNRDINEPFADVLPTQAGQVLMHTALLNHEGMHIEKGRRTVFVGFLELDRVDPFTDGTPLTGLSWYSSWGSWNWLETKMKAGHQAAHYRLGSQQEDWKNNRYIRSFMGTARMYLGVFTDSYYKHIVHNLVDAKNRDAFIRALDENYDQGEGQPGGKACWFKGQQVDVDINGQIIHEWSTRVNNNHRFSEL